MKNRLNFIIYLFTLVITVVSINGCSRNAATGETHFNLISESQEIQLGAESDKQIVAQMGLYNNSNMQNYIQTLGSSLAAKSERANLKWTFRVIDDPVVNAFALPGGYIYITRGILAHLNSEDELAGVIGHEIGHVTAKHSVYRMSAQQLTNIGLGLAVILEPSLQDYAQLASTGLGLLFLKFSRDDEREADKLGIRYMTKINKNPNELVDVMSTLDKVSGGGQRIPDWLATHPNPGDRIELIRKEIASQNLGNTTSGSNANFIAMMDGMTYGEDPREGYFKGNTFIQPEMQFQINFPQGWQNINQKQAVISVSPNQDAAIQLTLAQAKTVDEAIRAFNSQEGISANFQKTGINNLEAATGNFAVQTEQGNMAGNVTYVKYGNNVFQILAYGSQNNFASSYGNAASQSIGSFNKVTDQSLLKVSPKVLKVVTVNNESTLEQVAQANGSSVDINQLYLINGLDKGAKLTKGQKIKVVK